MLPENYFNYFTEVEEYFVQKRGRHLLVSPLDWCLIEVWRDSGIPLHVVFRGIERSFQHTEKKGKRTPKTLFYCHPGVMEAFEEYTQARTGRHEEADEGPRREPEELAARKRATEVIRGLMILLRGRPGEAPLRARRRLGDLADELERDFDLRLEEADRALNEAGSRLAQDLLEALDAQTRRDLKKEVRRDLKIYKKRLSLEMYRQLEKSYLERQVRSREGLPEFTLLETA